MTISNSIHFLERSGIRSVLDGARRHLGGRRSLWLIAGLVLAAGLTLKWNWLVAAGIAPVLVSLLPCAAMCALGFCAHKMASVAAPKPPSADGDADATGKS
jgi:hypothetical protein